MPRLSLAEPKPGEAIDPRSLFPRPVRAVWLEVGFGGGEHLAAQARANPDVGLIGCEVFLNGVASLVQHVARDQSDNVRIFAEDARRLFPALPDGCFERIFVLFPDPWPKKRHVDRRFIGPGNLPELSRLLADGGELRVASDVPVYIGWALEHLTAHPDFQWTAQKVEDCRSRPEDWAPTRYEGKALAQGKTCTYLRFIRKTRG